MVIDANNTTGINQEEVFVPPASENLEHTQRVSTLYQHLDSIINDNPLLVDRGERFLSTSKAPTGESDINIHLEAICLYDEGLNSGFLLIKGSNMKAPSTGITESIGLYELFYDHEQGEVKVNTQDGVLAMVFGPQTVQGIERFRARAQYSNGHRDGLLSHIEKRTGFNEANDTYITSPQSLGIKPFAHIVMQS